MAEEKADRDDPRTSDCKYVPFPITPPNAEVDAVGKFLRIWAYRVFTKLCDGSKFKASLGQGSKQGVDYWPPTPT